MAKFSHNTINFLISIYRSDIDLPKNIQNKERISGVLSQLFSAKCYRGLTHDILFRSSDIPWPYSDIAKHKVLIPQSIIRTEHNKKWVKDYLHNNAEYHLIYMTHAILYSTINDALNTFRELGV